MPRCCIITCRNDSSKKNLSNGGISYHRFPQDPFIKEKWIDATGRQNWMPSKLSTICSEHFDEKNMLISKQGRRFLSVDAVPVNKILIFHNPGQGVETKTESTREQPQEMTQALSLLPTKKIWKHFASHIDTETSPKKKKLKKMLKWSQSKIRKQALMIKRLQSRNSRLERKIKNIKDLINSLQCNFSMTSQEIDILNNIKLET